MSKRDFDKYYDNFYKDYLELQDTLKEVSQYSSENETSPDMMENITATIEPMKVHFEILSYVKYLLDMPNRESKKSNYKKLYKNINIPDSNSEKISEDLRSMIK